MFLACLLSTLSFASAGKFVHEKNQNKTLVLLDSWATIETHSLFFEHVRNMGSGNHTLEFKLISGNPNEDVKLQQFEKYFYDNIILMAPTVRSFGKEVKVKDLLDFVDGGHNIMVFASSDSRKVVRDIANEFGVDFEDYGYHMEGGEAPKTGAQASLSRTAWSSSLFEPLERVFSKLERPVLYEDGIGSILDNNENNKHVFPILRADPGSFSVNPNAPTDKSKYGGVSGQQLTLVAGYQTLYNQRVTLSGSMKMCSNEAMLANRDPSLDNAIESSPNYKLCTELVEWNLQERGVLRVDNVRHNKLGDKRGGSNPENYKRQVDIEYFVDIHQKMNGEWVPYVADDVQFQFTMLDPYYQVAMTQPDKSKATYTYQLKTPWRLGIFKFIVDYKRYGLTYIDNRMEVSVIQLRHDEFPRYEVTGYPYYTNVFVMMLASFIFVNYFAFGDYSKVDGVKAKQS